MNQIPVEMVEAGRPREKIWNGTMPYVPRVGERIVSHSEFGGASRKFEVFRVEHLITDIGVRVTLVVRPE
jgi:hypothetical protein